MELTALVREEFGIPLIGVQPTGLGADERAALFRGVTADGTSYAVKTSAAAQPGLAVADFLARQGVQGVPAPLRTRDGVLATALAGVPGVMTGVGDGVPPGAGGAVSVVPWIDEPRAIDTGLGREQWRAFGQLLGAVHATVPASPLVGDEALLPVDRHDPTAEVQRGRAFAERLRRARVAAPDDAVIGAVAALWARSGDNVLAVADLAETSALSRRWDSAEVVICHADPHHGNLLLGERGDVWLIDWDDAVLAPREADLIFVIGGVFSFAPITPGEVGWFFDGYSPASGGVTRSDVDGDRLTYYRSVRALTDFLDFADDALDRGRPVTERADALRVAGGALSPEGIVARAQALSS